MHRAALQAVVCQSPRGWAGGHAGALQPQRVAN